MRNVLSLFDGISCGQLALNELGYKYDNYYASEIEEASIEVTQKHFPKTIQLGDVLGVKGSDLPPIHLLMAGSPCQGFSLAGKKLNFEDPRSKLFFEFVRLVKECQPKHFFLENVGMKKEWINVITEQLEVDPVVINSDLVSAQNRKRIYWANFDIPEIKDRNVQIKDVLEPDTEPVFVHNLYGGFKEKKPRVFAKKSPTIRTAKGGGHIPKVMLKGTDVHSNCTIEYAKTNSRKLLEVEGERLQTLPDNYTEGHVWSKRFTMIGNGWTVEVIKEIFKGMDWYGT